MVDTIQKAFRPLSLIAFLIGSGNLRYPLNYWRFRLSVFYVIIVWSLYKYAFDAMLNAYTPKHIFNNHLSYYSTQTNIFVTLISVTITVLKYQKIHICIKKLSLVDDTLEKLGTPKEYHTIQNLIRSTLIIYFIVILILFITDSIWNIEKHNNIKAMFIGLIMGYPIYVSTLGNIIFAFVVRYIGTRLDKINGYIEQLSETEEYGLRFKWEKSLVIRHYVCNSENRKRVIWTVMHLHLELCRIARDINDLFGIQLTLQMISCFFILVTTFFAQYHMILCLTYIYENNSAKLKLILTNDIWCMVLLIKFISLNYICENVTAKVQKTKVLTHKLTNLIRFTETRREIYQFLLQISLRPLEFGVKGIFHFGHKFINKFFIWILTVIVFVLQMDTSPMSQISKTEEINETCFERNVVI